MNSFKIASTFIFSIFVLSCSSEDKDSANNNITPTLSEAEIVQQILEENSVSMTFEEFSNSNRMSTNSSGNVTKLGFYSLGITTLPTEIKNLTKLELLELDDNLLEVLPSEIGELSSLKLLDLGQNKLSFLPSEIQKLSNLEELYFGENEFSSIPSGVSQLSSLMNLELNKNKITSIPSSLGSLPNLFHMDLSDNLLTGLPSSLGNMNSLNNMLIGNNRICSPQELQNIENFTNFLRVCQGFDQQICP
ncbi:MAG: hypothetical protein DWQ06_03655 [Calditrichaeota bacterium]|nr:MAG: hypothetical protein DWQ06_03655 [Calditrichota bacterium]